MVIIKTFGMVKDNIITNIKISILRCQPSLEMNCKLPFQNMSFAPHNKPFSCALEHNTTFSSFQTLFSHTWITFKTLSRLQHLICVFPLPFHRNFQTFDNTAQASTAPAHDHNLYANVPPAQFGGSFLDPSQTASSGLYGQGDFGQSKAYTENEFDDEPPLLEGKN
jgi:hypothetical protein